MEQVLHIIPDSFAAGSLHLALRETGSDDEILSCPEDFSCGPVASLDPSTRLAWWEKMYEIPDGQSEFPAFWQRLDSWDGKLVLWFGRRFAKELSFLYALVDRLEGRRFFVVDVTGPQSPAIAVLAPKRLQAWLGTERELNPAERVELRARWQILVQENAPFRIVGETDLVSAPETYFDQALLGAASTPWKGLSRVIGETLGSKLASGQVGDLTLLARAAALIERGQLSADGDPRDMRSCKVRLPNLAR